MKIGIYPGSFDPVTCGHMDLIERAASLVDKLIVAVLYNPNKSKGLFSVEERIQLLEEVTASIKNVEVACFSGLLVDFAVQKEAKVIIRGLRSTMDLETEKQMAQINKKLLPEVETIFLMTAPEYAYLSSSSVRELALFKRINEGDVPTAVARQLRNNWE